MDNNKYIKILMVIFTVNTIITLFDAILNYLWFTLC
jgi:hypothetical protein